MAGTSKGAGRRGRTLILSCEHGGNRIPAEYRHLFRGADSVVASHRGWDPGALDLARYLGRHFHVPVAKETLCRLLVEPNRAPSNPRIWSKYSAGLAPVEKQRVLDRYWWPYRRKVEARVREQVARGNSVYHVAVHSFVPVLGGERRNAEICLLYDPARPGEKAMCLRWAAILREMDPDVRVRRNYPYRGIADGLPTWLRRRYPNGKYAGVELEINQAVLTAKTRKRTWHLVAESLDALSVIPA